MEKKLPDHEKTLIEHSPAEEWNQAYPLGNGALGAMVFGGLNRETFELNEESVWDGKPRNRINPDAAGQLENIRRLLRGRRIQEAEELSCYALSSQPDNQNVYQSAGSFQINFVPSYAGRGVKLPETSSVTGYTRRLDLQQALMEVEYTRDGIRYSREHFISAPARLFATRLSADPKGSLNLSCRFHRRDYIRKSFRKGKDTLIMQGSGHGAGSIQFTCAARIIQSGGTQEAMGDHIVVRDADEIILLITSRTSFRDRNPEGEALKILDRGSAAGWDNLKEKHIRDYRSYFDRMDFTLRPESGDSLPLSERLKKHREGALDNGLYSLYFHYGRYLLISSSRPGNLPANLQGIWNPHSRPPWGSKYTININTEMNYWPAEVCGLGDCHRPLFDHLKRMRRSGREVARKMYRCRGFAAHHNTDIWGDCAPQDPWMPATFWPLGAVWLCLHLLEHYRYTRDKAFLKDFFPVISECALFLEDFLIENNRGEWVTSPTVSPENTYIMENGASGRMCEGSAMDSQILREFFTGAAEWADLQKKKNQAERYRMILRKLPPILTGRDGRILEWLEEYEEEEPGHRHISHLFALFPGHQIRPENTYELCEAAEKSLIQRLAAGGGHTGWSRAWIINFWARLEKSSLAMENLRELLCSSTLPNLLCDHPPFQIDGNFGGTAGIVEMLVQSGGGVIGILPALPEEWPEGKITGVRLRGGYSADIRWEKGKLKSFRLFPGREGFQGEIISLRYKGFDIQRTLPRGMDYLEFSKRDFP